MNNCPIGIQLLTKWAVAPREFSHDRGSPWSARENPLTVCLLAITVWMTPLAKSVLWISLALWTRRALPRDGVGTRECAWSRDLSGDCLPNGARDPLGVRESRDLPTVTCSSGLGAESWVRNNYQNAHQYQKFIHIHQQSMISYDYQRSHLWDIQCWWGPVYHYLHCPSSPRTPGGRGWCHPHCI